MASSSSSPTQEKYDVFLSFRGEDTRNGFTSHLNAALCWKKIITFIDYELRRGDEISSSLLKAIEGSKISIVIFSKDYASSRWCLEELVKIMDCRKMHGQIVIPVFYHVYPSDVRKQSGTYGDAFANHEVRYRQKEEMLQRWRSALTDAANLSGYHSNVLRYESELVEMISKHTLKILNDMSSIDNKKLIGAAMKIQEIKSLLSDGPEEVCKVGIWGMGGIGKTTLAYAVFKDISSKFEASCFSRNVREASERGELSSLRQELLSSLLGDKCLDIRLKLTKERLRRKRVLIVFDDVIDLKQIQELIGDLEYVGTGSRIIITTRDKHVLKNCGLDGVNIYEVKGLDSDESLQLFKQHAFNQNHLINEDYMELSYRVINYTKGVPLALVVLGCFLLGREKLEWESALDELENSPNETIQTVLKISYDGLGHAEKELFLDIACFFEGWDKYLVGILSSHIGIRVLVDKALITISYKTIRMHDLLQEMGREIVRQESIYTPGRRSRLWHHDDVYRVLNKKMGTDTIRGLCFDMANIKEIHLDPDSFSKMDNLRFLTVDKSKYDDNNVYGFEGLEFDFAELRCLSWKDYPCTSLPLKFSSENLAVLKMRRSNLKQLWTGVKDLAHLKYIDLSFSYHLLKVPDLSAARNLESIILKDCERLVSLPIGIQSKSLRDVILSGCSNLNTAPRISSAIKELSSSIESPSRLVELNLRDCLRLESLPSNVCNLESLQQLDLSGLSNLKFVLGIPCNIKQLYLDGTAIKELSSSIENASSLVRLSLRDCSNLESLPDDICKLKSLRYLCISGCTKVVRLPEDIGNLESLEELEATGNSGDCLRLESLPSSIRNLNLRVLNLSGLSYLKMVPEFPLKIEELYLDGTAIKELSSSIENASSLVRLSLRDCSNLESLPDDICKLKSLKYLCISNCSKLERLPENIKNLESLEVLEANGVTIRELPWPMGRLEHLHD
ncbi:disease resistance-like protein DSC1 [Pistacia vera]|uniref:disease resistance-like protein DSC1 n=1 Tax=Pistacia vera TaxID=55513 RepID=UPI0012633A43|nr:disease resistance-like protein DSC1 [Pistacia vera]